MKCYEVFKYLEKWAPKEIAWERDNIGLQIGNKENDLTKILLCLDLTYGAVDYAIKNNCNLIITHHPLLFNPIKKLDFSNNIQSQAIEKIIKNNITVYSAHTNLDFTKHGVSFELAKTLKLNNIGFLNNLKSNQYKLVVFVPSETVAAVSSAIFNEGGGIIGEYSKCSYRTEGSGTFQGSDNTDPFIGEKGNLEEVNEIKLEVLVDSWKIKKVIQAMLKSHPYEEPAYDIYPLVNDNVNYGEGAVGNLERSLSIKEFLEHVSKHLNIKNFRYTTGSKRRIKKIAVMGGSGADYLKTAISKNADAYITADIKYHTFQEAQNKILLIDAGHYETEIHSLNEVKKRLEKFLKNEKSIKVLKYSGSTNPIIFYNN